MSTITELRLQLLANGYSPIRNRDKRTFMPGWPTVELTPAEIEMWGRKHKRDSATGLRVENGLAVIDFDINDKTAMNLIADRVFEAIPELGDPNANLLVRTGKGAKEAWFVRTDEEFGRIHSRSYTRPGEGVDDGTHRVEIFGGSSARQFGSFGPHTVTDDGVVEVSYAWPERSPEDTRQSELPELTKKQFFQIADIVEATLKELGWQMVERSSAGENEARASAYDLTEDMVFTRTLDGGQVTFSELEDMARNGMLDGERYEISPVPWLRPSSNSGGGCLAGATHDGTLFIHDCDETVNHFAVTEAPGENGDATLERAAKLKKIAERLGMPAVPVDKRTAPRDSQGDIALRFVAEYGDEMRYVEAWGWMRWDGKVWQKDDKGTAYDRAHQLCCENIAGAPVATARSMTSRAFAWAVVDLVKVHPKIASDTTSWDRDPWLLNTPDGVVDLRTGKMEPHNPDAGMTKLTTVSPGGSCPNWLRFIERATGGDKALIAHYQRACGYALTGLTVEHALFFLHGTGGNGKTTFVDAIGGIMGTYHAIAPTEMLMASRGDRHPTELAMLVGARLVTAVETEEGRHWAEAKLKQLTGGDRIAARFMRMDFFEYKPQFKLMVMGNHKPMLYSVDEAIRRRMNLWPFTVTITAAEKRADLGDVLREEWAGILQWMVEGCLMWAATGLAAPESVKAATDAYLDNEDVFGQWLDEETVRKPGAFTMSSRLFKHWERWAIERGETPGSMKKMVEKMSGRGYRQARTNAGKGFNGVDIGVSAPSNLKAGVVSEVVDLVARKLEKAKKDDKAAE
jgi:putative DNA primase/helicase